MSNYLDKLNPEQLEAVQTTEGAVRVLAGAGTGKTRALTSRYCYLTDTLGVAPKNIVCVTFTNRAANEMKHRIRKALGDMDLGYICTFHAFCVQLLKEDIHVLNFPKNFVILDVEDQKQMLLKIFEEMNLTLRETTIKRTIDEVLEAKKLFATSYIDYIYELNNEELKAKFSQTTDRNEEIFLRYLYEQKKCFGCDFNDIINFASYILDHFPDVLKKWQDRMQYVMVDEFQDVSQRQYKIAKLLSGKHGNLFIVGDPDQTIYSWRGSHVKLFLDFDKVYPDAKTILLTTNYRSTPEILTASNVLIEKNIIRFPKILTPTKTKGELPLYCHNRNEKEEAEWIYEEINQLVEAGASLNKIAILYRAHYLTRPLEECFIEKGLSYKIFSGIEFYGRREIKDIICYLRMLTSADDIAFLRTINNPSRKIGKKKIGFLKDYAESSNISLYEALKQNLDNPLFSGTMAVRYVEAIEYVKRFKDIDKMGDIMQMLLDRSGYEEFLRLQGDQERLDNVAELKRAIENAGQDDDATLDDFLSRIALLTNLDHEDERESVKMMTIHTSKGMEFPYVFICGLNEGVFPSRKINTPDEMDEERRLAYVAMTRAMDRLYLSDSEGISNDGIFKYPSRFIFDAGKENIKFVKELEPHLEIHSRNIASDFPSHIYQKGDRVEHPVFGKGLITTINMQESCYSILFDKFNTERNILFTAKIVRIESD
ncbi:ATP-dependent helicase [Prevotella sp. 10(H)]|uniref:ATP-dependent helicase n=1 Tax=Prevotella sp. 10(H) TaxID=1158294 RepID=UPI0004A70A80|nr:UvrD-helicase domain-containing protein [Prevotella sp. 10(H)]